MLRAALLVPLALCVAAAGCAHDGTVTKRLFKTCLKQGHPEAECMRRVGCVQGQTREACLESFKKRHRLYIHYE